MSLSGETLKPARTNGGRRHAWTIRANMLRSPGPKSHVHVLSGGMRKLSLLRKVKLIVPYIAAQRLFRTRFGPPSTRVSIRTCKAKV